MKLCNIHMSQSRIFFQWLPNRNEVFQQCSEGVAHISMESCDPSLSHSWEGYWPMQSQLDLPPCDLLSPQSTTYPDASYAGNLSKGAQFWMQKEEIH